MSSACRCTPASTSCCSGSSGSGKTTLAQLLVRFRDPQRGRVTLNGIDVRELRQTDVRAAVQLCGQDAHLFNTSLRENLLIADPAADDSALWNVLAVVELDTWAAALPHGLDELVGQFGERVSGGQRRRIALARALLSPAPFLILDEPTAHLDAELAARILFAVLDHCRDRGMLLITHDSAALDRFDRVLRLDNGRVTGTAISAVERDSSRQRVPGITTGGEDPSGEEHRRRGRAARTGAARSAGAARTRPEGQNWIAADSVAVRGRFDPIRGCRVNPGGSVRGV